MPLVPEETPAVEEQSEFDSPPRAALPKLQVYLTGCFCVTFMGGGLILGVGPFVAQLKKEGYLTDATLIFDIAFQLLTWGTVLASHLLGRLGPKITALVGLCISVPGIVVLAFLPNPAHPMAVTFAFGAIGAGGNHIYLASFQFASLFPENLGRADGVIAGLFNAAGLVLLIMNLEFMTIHLFFRVWLVVAGIVAACIILFYPNKPYSPGDVASFHGFSREHITNPLNFVEYKNSVGALKSTRYWLYVFSFSWASVYTTWVNGIVVDGLYPAASVLPDAPAAVVPAEYVAWAQPIITNATVLFTWIVGSLIDKFNFLVIPWVQAILCTCLVLLALFKDSSGAAWVELLVLNWTASVMYTTEFVFLHKVLKDGDFSTGLLVTLVFQALFQFVVSPGLTPCPWTLDNGDADYGPPCYMLLGLSALLYLWPLAECCVWRRQDTKAAVLLDSNNAEVKSDS